MSLFRLYAGISASIIIGSQCLAQEDHAKLLVTPEGLFEDPINFPISLMQQRSSISRSMRRKESNNASVHGQRFPIRWTQTFSLAELADSQTEADKAAERVKDAMRFCWNGYKKMGFGADDVRPLSGHNSNWANLGVSILESLDTLHLMGLDKEFDEADAFVRDRLTVPTAYTAHRKTVQTMEITIRALGGLLSAYSLTQKPEFLEKARGLGEGILKSAYKYDPNAKDDNARQSLLPKAEVDLVSTRSGPDIGEIFTAEAGTLQLEFAALSAFTGDPKFKRVSGKTSTAILDAMEREGRDLYSDTVRSNGNQISFVGDHETIGARGDSFLEYLIKEAVMDPSQDRLRKGARRILDGVFKNLVKTTKKGTTFIADLKGGPFDKVTKNRMDHLVCFLPGSLMLAIHNFPKDEVDPRWKPLAISLTETCHKMYKITDSHLAPEYTMFQMDATGDKPDMIVPEDAPWNLLRPETAESLFYMHYYTGDPKYRHWAKDIVNAFEEHSKGKYGFTAVDDVRAKRPRQRDSQESFFLAETLKYLYLIFAKPDTLSLDNFVLNTEAHPLAKINLKQGKMIRKVPL